jgi:D-3-phosphoglycerate dehydrogenase
MNTILITDSLFIRDHHLARLHEAGYQVERLDKPQATEDELVKAIQGKVGYILGGIESVTERVIDAADSLKVISFTGIGAKTFVPAWEYAATKGIALTNAPAGPTQAVAEWAVSAALLMNRNFLGLGRTGSDTFRTSPGLEGKRIGIVGYGRIGSRIAEMLKEFRPGYIAYWSPHQHAEAEQAGVPYFELASLLRGSDVVFLCVAREAGIGFFGAEQLAAMPDGALLVSFAHPGLVDEAALLTELRSGRLRAVADNPAQDEAFSGLPLSSWFCMNGSNAFNTDAGVELTSDMAVESLLNVLRTGDDQYVINHSK